MSEYAASTNNAENNLNKQRFMGELFTFSVNRLHEYAKFSFLEGHTRYPSGQHRAAASSATNDLVNVYYVPVLDCAPG